MAYVSPIVIETAGCSFDEPSAGGIAPHFAAEAARLLVARSPTHARRFARAMHRRIACGLDSCLIEHWARIVMEVGRITQTLS